MKISMKMADRDRRLLKAVSFLGVLVVMIMGVLRPLHVTIRSLEKQIENYEMQSDEIKRKAHDLGAMRASVQKKRDRMIDLQSELLPVMSSQKLDQFLTERAMQQGLMVLSIQIVMPEKTGDIPIFGKENDKNQDPNVREGIYVACVKLAVSGNREGLGAFLDEVSEQTRGVRVTEIDWEPVYEAKEEAGIAARGYQVMRMDLEIYMCPEIVGVMQ